MSLAISISVRVCSTYDRRHGHLHRRHHDRDRHCQCHHHHYRLSSHPNANILAVGGSRLAILLVYTIVNCVKSFLNPDECLVLTTAARRTLGEAAIEGSEEDDEEEEAGEEEEEEEEEKEEEEDGEHKGGGLISPGTQPGRRVDQIQRAWAGDEQEMASDAGTQAVDTQSIRQSVPRRSTTALVDNIGLSRVSERVVESLGDDDECIMLVVGRGSRYHAPPRAPPGTLALPRLTPPFPSYSRGLSSRCSTGRLTAFSTTSCAATMSWPVA